MNEPVQKSKASPYIDDVRRFWDENPLWTGEAAAGAGTREFFETHTAAWLGMAGGQIHDVIFPSIGRDEPVLDLGCGIGFWLEQYGRRGWTNLVAADLSPRSLDLARARCNLLGINARFEVQNAQAMTFPDGRFAHVNCIGVIHHSPEPATSVREIARVLRPGGTAAISVYYTNIALRLWPLIRPLASAAGRAGVTLRGRGRETMMQAATAADMVRLYDGADNPVGLSLSRRGFRDMLEPFFSVETMFGHIVPTRVLPVRLPRPLFRAVELACPFMICAIVRKG